MEDLIRTTTFNSVEELETYLKERALNHSYYKYYSNYMKIETILNTRSIYLSTGKNWNDVLDRNGFNSEDSDVVNFGLCLSFSKSENVAMWMLYSGNDGCMIDFPKALIQEILATNTIELGFFEGPVFKTKKILSREQFSISCFDILYYADTKHGTPDDYYVRRSDEVNDQFKKVYVDKLTIQKKTLPWSYENECRIVVTVEKATLQSPVFDFVKISFSDKYIEKIKERTYDSPNSKNLKYKKSSMKEKMQWNLCSACETKKKSYL